MMRTERRMKRKMKAIKNQEYGTRIKIGKSGKARKTKMKSMKISKSKMKSSKLSKSKMKSRKKSKSKMKSRKKVMTKLSTFQVL